jgi:hypothetical protein
MLLIFAINRLNIILFYLNLFKDIQLFLTNKNFKSIFYTHNENNTPLYFKLFYEFLLSNMIIKNPEKLRQFYIKMSRK